MSFQPLGKSLFVAFTILFLVACASGGSSTGPTTTGEELGEGERGGVVQPAMKTPEQIRAEENEVNRQERVIYFEFDDITVNADGQQLISEHAWFLSRNPSKLVVIKGHADERGTPEYNLALGERRGNAVRDILMSYGVSASQIRVVSYGEEDPAVPAHNEAAWAKNRRAELQYEG